MHEPTGGAHGFFFLPPMAPDAPHSGEFDPSLASTLRVAVRQLDDSGNPAGDDVAVLEGAAIQVDSVAEHYMTTWDTDLYGLALQATYRVSVQRASDKAQYGYADVLICRTTREAKRIADETTFGLVDGKKLHVKFRIETGTAPQPGPGLADSPWPMFGHDPMHTNRTTNIGPQSQPPHCWEFHCEIGSWMRSVSINTDGTIYFGDHAGKLYAVDGGSGTQKWSFATGGPVMTCPAISADGKLYFSCDDGNSYALDAATGGELWRCPIGNDWTLADPAIGEDGTIYVGGANGVHALDPTTGAEKWLYGGGITSSLALGPADTLYACGGYYGLVALNSLTGEYRWWRDMAGNGHGRPAVGTDGTVYIGSEGFCELLALNPDGSTKWEFPTGYRVISTPALGLDGTVYFGSGDKVYALDGQTGEQKWAFVTGGEALCSPVLDGNGTLYASGYGTLYVFAIDSATGQEIWRYENNNGDYGQGPVVTGDGKLVISARGDWGPGIQVIW